MQNVTAFHRFVSAAELRLRFSAGPGLAREEHCLNQGVSRAALELHGDIEQKLLSGAPARSLHRYLCFVLRGLNELGFSAGRGGQPFPDPLAQVLRQVADLVGDGLDGDFPALVAYPDYCSWVIRQSDTARNNMTMALQVPGILPDLRDCLTGYLDIFRPGQAVALRFGDLFYFRELLKAFTPFCDVPPDQREGFLARELRRLNFNHLGFLQYLQTGERCRLAALQPAEQLKALRTLRQPTGPKAITWCYDPAWPSLACMLQSWREELIGELAGKAQPAAAPTEKPVITKLPLNTSVTHLACLLRLLHDEGLLALPLAELFKLVPQHFSTKRQAQISPGSLSKEFYTTNQFTAARTRDMLLRLAGRVTARYFPVWLAISAIAYVVSGRW